MGKNRVRIPAYMVEEAIRSAPSLVTIWDREGRRAMELEGQNVYFGTGSDTPTTIDVDSGERRKVVKEDIGAQARVCDYLGNIDFVMCMGIASDVEAQASDLHHFEEMVLNTVKPIIFTAWSVENIKEIWEMCVEVAGGEEEFRRKPFAINYSEATSPLQHTKEATQKLLFCAEKDIPIIYVTGGYMGANFPVTVVATLAQTNAENLSGLVVHQLKNKGARFIGGGSKSPMDMRTARGSMGAPESYLLEAIQAELYSYYNLPFFGKGGCSDSKVFDQQVAIENTEGLYITGLSGVNLVHDVGYLESGLTSSIESIVMCNEIIGMVKRFIRSVEVTQEALGVEVIEDVGPGGNFLMHDHTLKHFREEIWEPELLDHRNWDGWVKEGHKSLKEVINERAKWILENHKPKEVVGGVRERLKEIIKKRERELKSS
jgi:trimethylamine--corrinoid protein Co-methyltransferase